ncbi:VanZ family protein [Halosaccharopolyspora lacisalsi]|nr:VanZ family protein [Halosaccharopolyspora lacisalsi]
MAGVVLGQRSVLVIFAVGAVLLGSAAWLLAVRRGWARAPAVLAGVSLALAVAVTQGRQPFQFGGLNFSACSLTSGGAGISEAGLNFAMLMPLGLFAAVATGRIVGPALVCVAVSVVFEVAQGMFDTGFCVGQDALINSVGGACAALVGGLVARHWFRRSKHAT